MATKKRKMRVTITYDGGIWPTVDKAITKEAKRLGGQSTGSGCMLIPPCQRDLDFAFETKAAAKRFYVFIGQHAKRLLKEAKAKARS
jgi:hypothetical protein